ncbi:MAG: nucleoside phosphorylase [Pleomorphochaeta sp.]
MDKTATFLCLAENSIGKYVFIPGSIERAELIANELKDSHCVAKHREFSIYNGILNGEKVSVVSTGIGENSASIALEEMIAEGSHTFLRIGSCASTSLKCGIGDVIIASGAVRMETVSNAYVPTNYSTVPNFHFFKTLVNEAKKTSYKYDTGVTVTKASFYTEVSPKAKAVSSYILDKWESYLKAGATTTSMEEAAIFAIGAKKKVRVASVAVCATNFNEYSNVVEDYPFGWEKRAIEVGINAMSTLIGEDRDEK